MLIFVKNKIFARIFMKKNKKRKIYYGNRNAFHRNERGKEYWRTISGYEPGYQVKVSDRGRVVIVPEFKTDEDGREFVVLCGRDVPVDLLVAQAFIPNFTESEVPMHKNGNMADSRVVNLKWVPKAEDPDAPGRLTSSLSLLSYILRPSLLADRDKEFTKFYVYLDYLWKTGQLPRENEQVIMDMYDKHRKEVTEDWISTNLKYDSVLKEMSNLSENPSSEKSESLTQTQTPTQPSLPPDLQQIADNQGLLTTPHIPNPIGNIPDEILAQALIELYDRAYTEIENNPDTFKRVPIKDLIPDLIHKAIARVVNQGPNPTFTWNETRSLMEMHSRSEDTGKYYVNYNSSATLLASSLTSPYHLNMSPQMPPVKNPKKAERTSHIQSIISMMQKDGKVPDWAFDAVLEVCGPELLNKLGFDSEKRPDGYSLKERIAELYADKKFRAEQARLVAEEIEKSCRDMSADDLDKGSLYIDRDMENPIIDSSLYREAMRAIMDRENSGLEIRTENKSGKDNTDNNDIDDKNIKTVKNSDISGFVKSVNNTDIIKHNAISSDSKKKIKIQTVDYWGEGSISEQDIKDIKKEDKKSAVLSFGNISGGNNIRTSSGVSGRLTFISGTEDNDTVADTDIKGNRISRESPDNGEAGEAGVSFDSDEYVNGYVKSSENTGSRNKVERPRKDELGYEIHARRNKVYTIDEIKTLRLVKNINTLPEYDEKGRRLYDDNMLAIEYDDSLEVPVAPARYMNSYKNSPMLITRNENRYRQSRELIKWLNDRKSIEECGKLSDGSDISPLYDPEKDITRGMINVHTGLEESSYYNERGQKVYHNVRYGQRYDPEIHTLFIPEMYEFPDMVNLKTQKELYIADYVDYLKKHNPEIGNPDILKKYYETAKAAKSLMSAIPNSIRQKFYGMSGSGITVRGWMPDGECVVFPSISAASEATGCSSRYIAECCRGEKSQIYGIRWELVDLADMDTMINRYIDRVMKVCEQGDVDGIDWDQYLSPEAKRRMESKLECIKHGYRRDLWLKYRDGLRYGFGDDWYSKWEPDSEMTGEIRMVEPDGSIMDLETDKYGEIPDALLDGSKLSDSEIMYGEKVRELSEELEDLKKKAESPLTQMIGEFLEKARVNGDAAKRLDESEDNDDGSEEKDEDPDDIILGKSEFKTPSEIAAKKKVKKKKVKQNSGIRFYKRISGYGHGDEEREPGE